MLWYLGADNRGVGIEWFLLGVGLRDVVAPVGGVHGERALAVDVGVDLDVADSPLLQ